MTAPSSSSASEPQSDSSRSEANGSLEQQLQHANEEIEKLYSLVAASQTINSTLDLDEMLPLILRTATENVGADRGTIYLVDQDRHEVWSKVKQGKERIEIRLPMGQGLAGYVAQTGEEILIEDAYNDPRFDQATDRATGYKTRSLLTTPMRNKERQIIGVFQLLNRARGSFLPEDVDFLNALSAHAAVAIENAYLHKESLAKKALEKELDVARQIQQRLIPATPPDVEGYELIGMNTPCDAVGGDYYDYIPLSDDRLFIAIGDVVGHGIPAALLMANLYAALRSHTQYEMDLADMVAKTNDFIHRSTDIMQYITMFCGMLDLPTGRFHYVNAGHNPPYHVHAGEKGKAVTDPLKEGGVPLGMMPSMPYESGSTELDKGDLLYLFTDGVTEAQNEKGDLLEEEALENCLKGCLGLKLPNVLHEIQVEIRAHTGDTPQEDDVTMMAVQRLP